MVRNSLLLPSHNLITGACKSAQIKALAALGIAQTQNTKPGDFILLGGKAENMVV